jgi:CheY-like chemotaxis protein
MEPSEFTLLVVDDNAENRDVLARHLKTRGFQVLEAEDGQAALDTIEIEHVDLVLLDIMMPGLSGIDVLRVLRQQPSTADLPVIMATAKSQSEDVVEALELGANDYVTKPLDFPVVLARVGAHLRSRRPARSPQAVQTETALSGEIQPGLVLADRYRIESRIGSGNFGSVYRALHLDLDRPVALKVLQSNLGTGSESLERFRREGIAACRIKHPNAVAVLDFGVTPGGVAYLVMELLEGHSLDDELNEEGALGPGRCAQILVPVCEALAEAHRSEIVHRDIKPANIFLHRAGQAEVPKVLDFGIAKIVGQATVAQKLTVDGWIVGTPAYMAPERFRNRPCGGKSDVYALGVTLYQALCGRLPFLSSDDDPMAVAEMHIRKAPPSLRRFSPELSVAVESLVMRTLKKRPENRPSAAELAVELARVSGGDALEPVAGPRPSPLPARDIPATDRSKR